MIKYTYNSNGSLASVTDKTANKTIYVPGQYNARGQMLDYTNSDGTIYNTLTYDDYGMPATVMAGTTLGGNEIQYLETHFNQYTGNLQYRTDHRQSLTETFTYDPTHNNRLVTWQVDGQPEYSMTYDDDNYNGGNILTKSDFTSSGNPYNYTDPNDPNHPHAVKSVTDPLQSPAETLQHIIYNSLNKVSEIIHTNLGLRYTIDYGPDEQRVKSQYFINNVLQKTKYYVGGDYEEEVNSNNVVTRRLHYLPGGGLYVLDQNNNGTRYYVLTDYQGSWCRVITDAGVTAERYSFDPWGRRRHPDNWNIYYVPSSYIFDRGYTGHEMLDAFGLINMNGRVYDPIIARFLSPDNYIPGTDNSQGFNRYSYCLNNPLIYTDPDGQNPILIMMAMQAIIGGLNSANNGQGFINGFVTGAAIGAFGTSIGASISAMGLAIPGNSIFAGAFNAALPAAIGGGFTYGFNSIATGQPFDWTGWGLSVGMAAMMGGIQGGVNAYDYNRLVGPRPYGEPDAINIWWGGKIGHLRNEWSFFNWDRPDVYNFNADLSTPIVFEDGCFPMTMAAEYPDRDANYWKNTIDEFHLNNGLPSGPIRSDQISDYFNYIKDCENINAKFVSWHKLIKNPSEYAAGTGIIGNTKNWKNLNGKTTGHEMPLYKLKVWQTKVDANGVPKFSMYFWNHGQKLIVTPKMQITEYGFNFNYLY